MTAGSHLADAATDQERIAAVERGLAYLYKTQTPTGYWGSSEFEQSATGAAAFALLSQRDKWGANEARYQAAVDKAISYLLSSATTNVVSTGRDGAGICPGGRPSCIGVYWSGGSEPIYATGLVAPALAAYGAIAGLNTVAATNGPLAGMTWGQIAQAVTNAILGMRATRGGGAISGWRETIRGYGDSEFAATQSAIIALLYDESAGAVTPAALRDDLKATMLRSPVAVCRTPAGGECGPADIGSALLAMKFAGADATHSQMQAAFASLNNKWQSTASSLDRGNFGQPYAMWMVYAGLQTTIGVSDNRRVNRFLTGCGLATTPSGDAAQAAACTWADDYTEWLVRTQDSDGGWAGYSYWTGPVATALYVNILGQIRIPTGTYVCPTTADNWAQNANWPARSLMLGGRAYTINEFSTLLRASRASVSDERLPLAQALLAAKLNIAQGSNPVPAAKAVAEADALLGGFDGGPPSDAAASPQVAERMANTAKLLVDYNAGSSSSACAPAGTGMTHNRTLTDAVPGAATDQSTRMAQQAVSEASPRVAGKSRALRPHTRKGITGLTVSADGTAVASSSTDKIVRVWSATAGIQRLALPASLGVPLALTYNGSGNTLSSAGSDALVRVWDGSNGTALAKFAGHDSAIRAVSASPDGKFLGSAGESSRVMLWDLTTRKLSRVLYGPANFVNALSFSPDSRLLASGSEDARVLILNVATGKTQYTLRGHSGPVDAVAFSPDGTLLASAGQDTVVHLWSPSAGVQLSALAGHSAPIRAISFSSDSRLLATGGEDTNVLLWDVRAGKLQRTLSGSPGAINAVVFDPKGRFLASADDTGYITLWNVNSGARLLTIKAPTAP